MGILQKRHAESRTNRISAAGAGIDHRRRSNSTNQSIEQTFKVYPNFELKNDVLSRLGKPLNDPQEIKWTYQAKYDLASIIWIQNSLTFYILFYEDQKWTKYNELSTPVNQSYWDEKWLKTHFPNVPKGRLPPFSGIARFWDGDPSKWLKMIGWREWHTLIGNAVFQEFDKGIVIGPVINNPNMVDRGVTLILYKDYSWEEAYSKTTPVVSKVPEVNTSG